jgi:hypothetical protein
MRCWQLCDWLMKDQGGEGVDCSGVSQFWGKLSSYGNRCAGRLSLNSSSPARWSERYETVWRDEMQEAVRRFSWPGVGVS